MHEQTALYIDSKEEKKENKCQIQGNWEGGILVCSYLAKICRYMRDVWFFLFLWYFTGKITISFSLDMEAKENSLCTVTYGYMQFINKKIKVFKVVSTNIAALKTLFSSRAPSVSSPVTGFLGSTANCL